MQDTVCAVCGRRTALAPGAAMACPSCGAPLSAQAATEAVAPALANDPLDDSSTRPSIPPIPPATPDAPDAPDSPASEDDAHVTRDVEATADFPTQPAANRTQTVPAAALPSTEPSAPPRKRSRLAPLSIALLILLLLAIGAAGVLLANGRLPLFSATPTATAAPTATLVPTATPPANLKSFTDGDRVFQMGYPTGWLVNAKNDPGTAPRLAIFANPPAQASFNVGTLSTTDVPAQGIVEQELTVLAQKSGVANRSGPTTQFFAGQTWTQESGDVTVLQNGKPTAMHAIALATIRGGHTVYILELAPVDTFQTVEPDFQRMLQSFEFLS